MIKEEIKQGPMSGEKLQANFYRLENRRKKKKEKATMHSSFYLVRDGLIKCYCKNSEITRESRLSIIKRIENVSEQGRSKGKVKNGN